MSPDCHTAPLKMQAFYCMNQILILCFFFLSSFFSSPFFLLLDGWNQCIVRFKVNANYSVTTWQQQAMHDCLRTMHTCTTRGIRQEFGHGSSCTHCQYTLHHICTSSGCVQTFFLRQTWVSHCLTIWKHQNCTNRCHLQSLLTRMTPTLMVERMDIFLRTGIHCKRPSWLCSAEQPK